jgi:CRP-like cAMP-binding protein
MVRYDLPVGAHVKDGNPGAAELRARLRAVLQRNLPACRPDTIQTLARMARLRFVRPGEPIYGQGEVVQLGIILRGYAVSERTTEDGHVIMSGVVPDDRLFGYSGIAGSPSSVGLIALTTCDVAQWPTEELRPVVAADPGFALAAIDSMAASLHQTIESIEGFLHQDARRRVMRILSRHRSMFFGEPAILTRAHLPGLVGTSREMTGRVLRQLEREGTIERFGRTGIRLLRPEALDADVGRRERAG